MAETELKPVSFRIDGNVKEKFREIAEATGNNQQETMQLLINAYYMQERKVDLPEHKASIEKFEQCATNMIQMFTDALQTNHDLRESVLQEFSATMDSKDKVIQNLQDQMAELKAAKENAEKTAQEQIHALERTIKELEKDHATEKRELQSEAEQKLSAAQKDAALETLNAVAAKEREMNGQLLQLERENAKLQAKIELLEARLQQQP